MKQPELAISEAAVTTAKSTVRICTILPDERTARAVAGATPAMSRISIRWYPLVKACEKYCAEAAAAVWVEAADAVVRIFRRSSLG